MACPECGRTDGFVVVRQECSADPARLAVRVERVVMVCRGAGRGEHAIEMTRRGLKLHREASPPVTESELELERKRKNGVEDDGVDTDLKGLYRRR